MNAVDYSIRLDTIGSKSGKFKLERTARKWGDEKLPDTFLNLTFDLRVELADSFSHLRRIPSSIPFHKFWRPNTVSWLTHRPFSACFKDRRSARIDFWSLRISIVSMSPSN